MAKALVCPCEDVTVEDIRGAIAEGFRDLESVKRYTGLGTGFCQGKTCEATAARLLAEAPDGADPGRLAPFTPRPPLHPTELYLLAGGSAEARGPEAHAPGAADVGEDPSSVEASLLKGPVDPDRRERLPERARIIIVGGGIMGLALAYALTRTGERSVVVLEQSYLCAGASGRNGGGVRMQWGTATNITLARRSIQLMRDFARELGINVWLRQGGYLFLAVSPEGVRRMERSATLHHAHGVETELLTPQGAQDLVPELSTSGILLAAYHRHDGVVFPWPFLWGYADGARRGGARVEPFTQVTGFDVRDRLVRAVRTDRGAIACDQVVIACGAYSPQVARLAGVALPNRPYRHEILSTEPLKPFLTPLVSELDSGLYFSQSMRGELVGGMGDPTEPTGLGMGSSFGFLTRFARALTHRLPRAGNVRVLRQWAGPYDVTPDNSPILGRTPGLSNMLQMSGFVGHGFMMAPAVAERMAAWMRSPDNGDELFSRFTLARFEEGRLEREDMIIG